ncbi:MAG: Hsp20/alpha crystallin family protein [Hormoscilla sp. SP5CHS1]|nr:Hsp20/alpha crystallin family protein [Hormoscilla sp. SP5CHS1]
MTLDIQATAEAVSVSGDRKSETKTEDKGMTRTEFRYGKFGRVIPLPGRINNQNVEAEYKDGILTRENFLLLSSNRSPNLIRLATNHTIIHGCILIVNK